MVNKTNVGSVVLEVQSAGVSVCLSVCLSVTALAASAWVHSGYKQYTWVSRRLFLDFDSWIFEKH